MLLTSSGDNCSSLSIDSLHQQRSAVASSTQLVAGDNQTASASSSLKMVRRDRAGQKARRASTTAIAQGHLTTDHTLPMSAQATPHQDALSVSRATLDTEPDGLQALRQAAKLNALRKSRARLAHQGTFTTVLGISKADYTGLTGSYAAPLSPLKARDITALSDLFGRDDMPSIEVDVNHRLLLLLPEPCWEDDGLDALKEFL